LSETEGNPSPSPAPRAEPAPSPPASPPATWRDPWAWLTAAAVLGVVWRSRGNPRGEAFAEDFEFIRHLLLENHRSLLDGGGSQAFWRPVSHQLYYLTVGRWILPHPGWVAALHIALLATGAVLLFRVLRLRWSGPMAAAAASFPLLAESTRTLICWPSHFVDLGAFLFAVLAIHEVAFRRLATGLLALLAALLCKELALVAGLLLPFVPALAGRQRGPSRTVALASGAAIAAWAVTWLWVRRSAGLALPHGLESDPRVLATPVPARLSWALWNSLRGAFSLPFEDRHFWTIAVTLAALLGLAIAIARDADARKRWHVLRGWCAWGAAWCVISWLALATIYPLWAPNRSQLGSVGLGVGAVALAAAAHPALPPVLVAVRLAFFALAPGTPKGISPVAPDRGAFMDYPRMSRLQQLMLVTRRALRTRFPRLPHSAVIGVYALPLSTEYAFGDAHAIQCWYRDTTLAWAPFDSVRAHPGLRAIAFLCYQRAVEPQMVLLDPEAVGRKAAGVVRLQAGDWSGALTDLARADAAQTDRQAQVFLGDVAGRRAYCWAQLGQWAQADSEARVALRVASEDLGARYVVAAVHAVRHERSAALAELDTLLAMSPHYDEALALREGLRRQSQR